MDRNAEPFYAEVVISVSFPNALTAAKMSNKDLRKVIAKSINRDNIITVWSEAIEEVAEKVRSVLYYDMKKKIKWTRTFQLDDELEADGWWEGCNTVEEIAKLYLSPEHQALSNSMLSLNEKFYKGEDCDE